MPDGGEPDRTDFIFCRLRAAEVALPIEASLPSRSFTKGVYRSQKATFSPIICVSFLRKIRFSERLDIKSPYCSSRKDRAKESRST